VPFLVSGPAGGVGDGNSQTPGRSSDQLLCLTDLFATFADITATRLPDNAAGEKGAEDSYSLLAAFRTDTTVDRPMFVNDHREAGKEDAALAALRMDAPRVNDRVIAGHWKILFDSQLLRAGIVNPLELYDLATDSQETNNRISEPALASLVEFLSAQALNHRTAGGHRLTSAPTSAPVVFDWTNQDATGHVCVADQFRDQAEPVVIEASGVAMTVALEDGSPQRQASRFALNQKGLGISGGQFEQVDAGEALLVSFDQDVLVEYAALIAGQGVCGGFYQVGDASKLSLYCVDADIDSKDQSGVLSDIGVLRKGQTLRLDCSPRFASEDAGRWRLQRISVRRLLN